MPPDVFATDYLHPLVLATKSLKRLTQSIDWDVRRRFLKLAAQSLFSKKTGHERAEKIRERSQMGRDETNERIV